MTDNALKTEINGRPAEACVNCIYFRRLPVNPQNIGAKPQGGICKRNPPTAVVLIGQGPGGQVVQQLQSFFPPVPDGELCGSYDDGIDEEDEAEN